MTNPPLWIQPSCSSVVLTPALGVEHRRVGALATHEGSAVARRPPQCDRADCGPAPDRLDRDQATEPETDRRHARRPPWWRADASATSANASTPRRDAVRVRRAAGGVTGARPVKAHGGKARGGQVLGELVAGAVGGDLIPAEGRAEHDTDAGRPAARGPSRTPGGHRSTPGRRAADRSSTDPRPVTDRWLGRPAACSAGLGQRPAPRSVCNPTMPSAKNRFHHITRGDERVEAVLADQRRDAVALPRGRGRASARRWASRCSDRSCSR